MGVTTNVILIGNVTSEQITALLKNSFDAVDNVEMREQGDYYALVFPEPRLVQLTDKEAHKRTMYVFPNTSEISDFKDVYDGERTLINLSSWGSHEGIAEALAKEFGGYVDLSDRKEWKSYEPTTKVLENVSDEDNLKIKLAQVVSFKEANILAKLVDNPDNLEKIMNAYSEYQEAKNEASNSPKM